MNASTIRSTIASKSAYSETRKIAATTEQPCVTFHCSAGDLCLRCCCCDGVQSHKFRKTCFFRLFRSFVVATFVRTGIASWHSGDVMHIYYYRDYFCLDPGAKWSWRAWNVSGRMCPFERATQSDASRFDDVFLLLFHKLLRQSISRSTSCAVSWVCYPLPCLVSVPVYKFGSGFTGYNSPRTR